mgnify:CR=1
MTLLEQLAAECMASEDPYRELAGAIGRLSMLQLAIRRGKGRPSVDREAAVAGPHKSKRKAKAT